MASLLTHLAFFFLATNLCYAWNPKLLNVSQFHSGFENWSPARASWHGNPSGAGSDEGSCGYKKVVKEAPFSSLVTSVASSLYNSGKGCGTCYQVKCTTPKVCSGRPVRVVVTDECPGCDSQSTIFDLSGTSFGSMASSGQSNALRNLGIEQIQYKRVDCNFPGVSVAFRVDPGSNPNYFAIVVEYEDGNGITEVELRRVADSSRAWIKMQVSWGAVWKVNLPSKYPPPFSVRLTDVGGKTIVAEKVIPANYSPGQTYRSFVNF